MNNTSTVSDNKTLTITTDKYQYSVKFVGLIDNTSPYNGWQTFDITVGAFVPKARGQGMRLKNIIKGDIRQHPQDQRKMVNANTLSQILSCFLMGNYIQLLDTNKKLTQLILDDVIDDYIKSSVAEGTEEVNSMLSMRNPHKQGKMPNVAVLMHRTFVLDVEGNYRYDGTILEAGSHTRGIATNAFRVNANDSAKPMTTKELQAVLFTSLYKLTADLETLTGFNPKEL